MLPRPARPSWALGARRAAAQAKPTITYWNGLTGADGKVMDELIDQFTKDTGMRIEQQRIPWADLYAKLQVSVPAGQGPDIALIHTVEVPHFASDGVLEAIDEARSPARDSAATTTCPRPGRAASTRASATPSRSTCPSTSSI